MSLVGSLEDLGLVDILQIVSLSGKSGVLSLRSDCGQGQIVLRQGLVQGASIQGDAERLRELLHAAGEATKQELDRAEALMGSESLPAADAVLRTCEITEERLDDLKREAIERAVMRMFGWRSGEFSFEIRERFEAEDEELLLASGLNTQYLAMEATRLGDEGGFGPQETSESEIMFSGESTESAAVEQVQDGALPEAVLEPEAVAAEPPLDAPEAAASVEDGAAPTVIEVEGNEEPAPDQSIAVEAVAPSPSQPPQEARHLIVVDPDLSGLEWFKASVEPMFRRVHIFQRCSSAIDRIRQYLVRGVVPIVVIADSCQPGDRDAAGIVSRLRALSSAITILCLRNDQAGKETPGEMDGVVVRPGAPTREPDRWHLYESLAERLRSELDFWLRSGRSEEARRRARSALGRLKTVSERLRDPSSSGEVLNVVMEFAAEDFDRVAIFMLRNETLQGVAQHGLEAGEGPDDEGLRSLLLEPAQFPELFRSVLERRSALRSNLRGPNDRALAHKLGIEVPAEAYAAPIESSGEVVALIYCDNHPADRPIRDTTAFEIVLHEAGLVLDRAVLERVLAVQAPSGD